MQGLISSDMRMLSLDPLMPPYKDKPTTREWEERAKNLLKAELRRRGVTYADLAERLTVLGLRETEQNINNKISRGGFTAAFLLQCLAAIGADSVSLLPP
jgi:hypothetical protein